jgi:hypothetical protein
LGLENPNSGLDSGETFFPNSGSDLDSDETFQISRNVGLDIDEIVCLLDSQLWLSQDGGREDFPKNYRASLFNYELSNEHNFGRIHLAGQYL